jgi:hypothetical protein
MLERLYPLNEDVFKEEVLPLILLDFLRTTGRERENSLP